MKYAVTGANGMIGKALVLRLVSDGHDVTAIYRSELPVAFLDEERITLATGDVRDAEFIKKAIVDVDGVFHVAAFAKPWARDESIYVDINVEGTKNICEACIQNGVKRLIYTASAGIHGSQIGNSLISENAWPASYETAYEKSKYDGMQCAFEYQTRGLEVNVVSPARVYAPGPVTESNVPARLMDMYVNKGFALAPTDGLGIGSYAFIDVVVHGHILAMQFHGSGEEYLLGGENVNYIDFFAQLSELTGKKSPVFHVPYQLSLFIGKANLFMADTFNMKPTITTPWVRRYLKNWGVSSKKIELLGYTPRSLREGMKLVLESWN
jgi:farnesol dehydrogenase